MFWGEMDGVSEAARCGKDDTVDGENFMIQTLFSSGFDSLVIGLE